MTNVDSDAAPAAAVKKQTAFSVPRRRLPVTLGSINGLPEGPPAAPRVSSERVTAHRFAIGEIVDLTPNMFRAAAAGQYEICRLMPASERDGLRPSYRIKSVAESHERVASEDELTLSHRSESTFS